MMTKKLLFAISAGLFLILVLTFTLRAPKKEMTSTCVTKTETTKMQDSWLAGVLDPGRDFEAQYGWYSCNKPKVGDLVLYRLSNAHQPVVRIVQAVAGDQFQLIPVEGRVAWNIKINGTLLEFNDRPYRFGSAGPPALALYQEVHRGQLDETSVLLFSTVSPGDTDSGSLGVISVQDLLAKVLPK